MKDDSPARLLPGVCARRNERFATRLGGRAPGGLFPPSLAIGAGIGSDVALLANHVDQAKLIALGMAAFLAATTQVH